MPAPCRLTQYEWWAVMQSQFKANQQLTLVKAQAIKGRHGHACPDRKSASPCYGGARLKVKFPREKIDCCLQVRCQFSFYCPASLVNASLEKQNFIFCCKKRWELLACEISKAKRGVITRSLFTRVSVVHQVIPYILHLNIHILYYTYARHVPINSTDNDGVSLKLNCGKKANWLCVWSIAGNNFFVLK